MTKIKLLKRLHKILYRSDDLMDQEDLFEAQEIVDKEFVWKNFTVEEQNAILAAGRSNNYLDTSRLESLYPEVKGIKESVRDMLVLMKR